MPLNLVLLDVRLPGEDGLAIARRLLIYLNSLLRPAAQNPGAL